MTQHDDRLGRRQALALLGILLVVGGGFCLFGGDGHHQVGRDLCAGLFVVGAFAVFAVTLWLVGRCVSRPSWSATPATSRALDPPPRFVLAT